MAEPGAEVPQNVHVTEDGASRRRLAMEVDQNLGQADQSESPGNDQQDGETGEQGIASYLIAETGACCGAWDSLRDVA